MAVAVAIGSAPRDASACSYSDATPLEVIPGGGGAAPEGVGEVTYTVQRGRGPQGSCTRQMSTSCDDSGTITLHFSSATDTDTAADQVGYELELVRGAPPGEGLLPSGPVLAFFEQGNDGEAIIWLHWDDGATDDQESIDFSITVTAVDAQGNRGPTSEPIRIRNDGDGGCALRAATGARGIHGSVAVLLLIVASLARRSRGRAANR